MRPVVLAAVLVVGCKQKAAAPSAPPPPAVALSPLVLQLTPAQKAVLGPPCVVLAEALCDHLKANGSPEQCDRLDPLRKRLAHEDLDCRFGLTDAEAQRALLAQVAQGACCDVRRAAILERRAGDPDERTGPAPKLRFAKADCDGFDEWARCLTAGCRVRGLCVAGQGPGRCDPGQCESVHGGELRNPRGGVCALSARARGDTCALLWRPEVEPTLTPIDWQTLDGRRVGCASQRGGSCRTVLDPAHPAGWRCEGTECSAWIDGREEGQVSGCVAIGPSPTGRCVPYRVPGPGQKDTGVMCRDLDPPCASCAVTFGHCTGVADNPRW